MYKILNIGGQDYKLEYSIEASLYADCVSGLTSLMTDIEIAGEESNIKKLLSGISNIPQTALVMFYAGLMEAHGTHPDGDGKVPNIETAKKLIAQYIKEHSGEELGNFYGIMLMCVEQMGEDGFFNLVGLFPLMEKMTEPVKKSRKVPQDHKKASGK